MPRIQIPQSRQLPGLQYPSRRDFTSEILAIRGQNPLAQGIETAGQIAGTAIGDILKKRRELAQLMALSKQLANQNTPSKKRELVRVDKTGARTPFTETIAPTPDEIKIKSQKIFNTLKSLGSPAQALNIAGQKLLSQQLQTPQDRKRSNLELEKLQADIEKTRREPNYVAVGPNGTLQYLPPGAKPYSLPTAPKTPEQLGLEEEQKQEAKTRVSTKKDYLTQKANLSTAIKKINELLPLNDNSYAGRFGAAYYEGKSALDLGVDDKTYENTAKVINAMQAQVALMLKPTFGGQLSEGEREYLNGVYGALPHMSKIQRATAMKGVIRLAQQKAESAQKLYEGFAPTAKIPPLPIDPTSSINSPPAPNTKGHSLVTPSGLTFEIQGN